MRIRLVHTQALLLLCAVLMAVLAMGALSAWNLRNGFSDYLATRDVERLEQFALLVSQTAERAGSIASLEVTGMGLQELFRCAMPCPPQMTVGCSAHHHRHDLSTALMPLRTGSPSTDWMVKQGSAEPCRKMPATLLNDLCASAMKWLPWCG